MKTYTKPELEKIEFSVMDALTASTEDPEADIGGGTRPGGWGN